MKKVSVLTIVLLSSLFSLPAQNTTNPTLMQINGKDIKLSEFEYIYNKNNSSNVVDKKTLEEYVDLFVIFKMKVEEAVAQGIDTTKAFKNEYEMYRNQLAQQYLQDEEGLNKLLEEGYERKKEERNVSHILIRIGESGNSADTLKAYNRAMEIYERAKKEDFEKLALEVSEDPSVSNNEGKVGWISLARTPYVFETTAYNTPEGNVSKPVRTFLGYHIIKVNKIRQSPGEVRVSHIMLMHDNENPENNKRIKERADSMYISIMSGGNFEAMARSYSQDPGSANKGGELPWFGSGQMVPEFEDAAFALEKPGDVSKPVSSNYGWHIIKLLEHRHLANFSQLRQSIKSQVEQSDRAGEIEKTFINKLKKEYNFAINETALNQIYEMSEKYLMSDSLFMNEALKLNSKLFSFADKEYSQHDFLQNVFPISTAFRGIKTDYLADKLNAYVSKEITEYERTQLPHKYSDYRNLLQEYHDGILLFEIMNQEVWEKASLDTEGLAKYFEDNKKDYAWDEPHYKGRIIFAKDKETLKAAKKIIKNSHPDSIESYLNKRLNDSIKYVRTEKGLWKKGVNPYIDNKVFKVKNSIEADNEFPYYYISGKLLKTYPEDYTDVRGTVTANYQDFLEKNWVEYLRNKYAVKVEDNVLKTVKKN